MRNYSFFSRVPDREQMIRENMYYPVPESIDAGGTLSGTLGMFNNTFTVSDGVADSEQMFNHMISKFDTINEQTGYRFEKEFVQLFLVYRNQILAALSRHYYGFERPTSKIENEMLHELNDEIKAKINMELCESENDEIEQYGRE